MIIPTLTTRSSLEVRLGRPTAKRLAVLGIYTVGELLQYLPRRYHLWGQPTALDELKVDEVATVHARVEKLRSRRTRSGMELLSVQLSDGTSQLEATFFGRGHWGTRTHAQKLTLGTMATFSGKVKQYRGVYQLSSPTYEIADQDDDDPQRFTRPIAIYPASEKCSSAFISTCMKTILDTLTQEDIPEILPPQVVAKHKLCATVEALEYIHRPEKEGQWRLGRKRLAWNEAFILQSALAQIRQSNGARPALQCPIVSDGIYSQLLANLPWPLTPAQREVLTQLGADLAQEKPMMRLLQGDVGAGKTIVALACLAQVVDNGYQGVLVAPTEVLAVQHFESIVTLLGDMAGGGSLFASEKAVRVELLTASVPMVRRREILAQAAAKTPMIIVGTHALLQDQVQLPSLALVVIDEQHRFGVAQRDRLRTRGEDGTAHLLVMTATPIPRTIAMTVFGDLETSVLGQLPKGRQVVKTFIVPALRIPWVERIWARAAEEISAGGRVFVVVPRIDENSGEQDLNEEELFDTALNGAQPLGKKPPLASIMTTAASLVNEPALAGIGVGILHGRLSAAEKDAAMKDFISGKTPLLVATTVIEVGIDVPAATMMVILDADRFGLSQLHQLRGRVGRGTKEAVCMALTTAEPGTLAMRRLEAFAQTTDGFQLAEADLELRREGDVLGASQSGRSTSLDVLKVTRDKDLIAAARTAATSIVTADPELKEHPLLLEAIKERLDESAATNITRT